MRTLVIGGTLFIGKRLVTRLLEEGHEVSVLHRRERHGYGNDVGNLVADRNDAESVRRALRGQQFDWVFDNVYDWERGTTAEDVESTARACGDGIERYVFMSSCAVYGEGLNRTEDDPLVPEDHPFPYMANKAASERALFRMHRDEGFPAVTLRPPYVYGPENPFYRERFFWDRLRDGRKIVVPGDGSRLMHLVYVNDLAEACLLAAAKDEATGEAFNVAHREPISQLELVKALAATAGADPQPVLVPRDEIEVAGGEMIGEKLYFGEVFDLPALTEVVNKAERVLGLRPVDFMKGLEETYSWYVAHHEHPQIDYTFEDALLAGK